MDEIDSIGSSRGKSSRGDSEVQRTMMELLNQLDGFEPSNKIKVKSSDYKWWYSKILVWCQLWNSVKVL